MASTSASAAVAPRRVCVSMIVLILCIVLKTSTCTAERYRRQHYQHHYHRRYPRSSPAPSPSPHQHSYNDHPHQQPQSSPAPSPSPNQQSYNDHPHQQPQSSPTPSPAPTPEAPLHTGPIYKNPSAPVEARVSDLLSRMTLEEKIGQMTQIERTVANGTAIPLRFIGSVLSGGGSAPSPRATPAEWADMVDSMQKLALSTRLGIPLLYGIDAVHGHNNVYGATIFPHNIGLGATRDPNLLERIGQATAVEVRSTGIPYAFAPCLAVCRDPRWGRCYESFGEEPSLVNRLTAPTIYGLQGSPPLNHPANQPYAGKPNFSDSVVACAKHYVGDGGTVRGIDENNTILSYQQLQDIHLKPYYSAIASGVSTIMISYSSWNGVKMSANKDLITDVLKKEMGFNGFTISDWEALDRITDPPGANYTYSVDVALNAGIDMVMVPYNYDNFISTTLSLVNSGHISKNRIDDAVQRILRVKFLAGLFEKPMADRTFQDKLGSKEHRDLAREAVRKSLVLLLNGEGKKVLPLSKEASKILVAGTHAHDIGLQCGGWTGTWQGMSGNNVTVGTTILEGIRGKLGKGEQEVVYKKMPTRQEVDSGDYEYAIVVVGEKPYAEFFGDDKELEIPEEGVETIKNVCQNVICVVVLVSGRPLVVAKPWLKDIDALVAAWLPGSEAGPGIADVLFGDYDFQGKLPRTWFRSIDQLPMNVGDSHYYPLFPFGYGLTTRMS
ncbi:hypothetical protein GOP47_0011468 [Adiantum capillus-veneris]|uniref:beta-glucosidase n=1 Tax=Adiantum capillus-veneris TaxID=13818 RepID=A0A9D4USV6_ADICA|nr:hypothetical protein GOP47_0011468 [Adiantum capillus-veneris]